MGEKIPSLFEDCHSKVKRFLDAANSVVLTTDMWTSRATEAYLTSNGHIIDENWEMQAYVLETSSFSGKHSADNICSELKRITDKWGITAKIQAVVPDNGANMVVAVRKAGWAHYPCFAHTINVVVKDSIKTLPELLDIQVQCYCRKSSQCLSEEHWSMVGLSLDASRPFEEVTREISSEKRVCFKGDLPGCITSEINCISWGPRQQASWCAVNTMPAPF